MYMYTLCVSLHIHCTCMWLILMCLGVPSILPVSLSDVKGVADPLSKVEAGLKVEGAKVPLQSVHIRAQLIDLAAKVRRACRYCHLLTSLSNISNLLITLSFFFPFLSSSFLTSLPLLLSVSFSLSPLFLISVSFFVSPSLLTSLRWLFSRRIRTLVLFPLRPNMCFPWMTWPLVFI